MRIKRRSEIGVPKVIQIGDIIFDQRWYKPSVARVSQFMNDLKSIPDFSKYKFILTGSFISLLSGKNNRSVWDLDLIVAGDRDLSFESIRNTMISVLNIGCGKNKMFVDTYFMYLDEYAERGTSSICNPNNKVINQYKGIENLKIRSITKSGLYAWDKIIIDGVHQAHAKLIKEVGEGLWKCKFRIPTEKHASRIESGEFFGDELLLEEYLSKYPG